MTCHSIGTASQVKAHRQVWKLCAMRTNIWRHGGGPRAAYVIGMPSDAHQQVPCESDSSPTQKRSQAVQHLPRWRSPEAQGPAHKPPDPLPCLFDKGQVKWIRQFVGSL